MVTVQPPQRLVQLALFALVIVAVQGCVNTVQTPAPTVAQPGYQQARAQAMGLPAAELRAEALAAIATSAPPMQAGHINLEAAEQWLIAGADQTALALAEQLDFSTDSDEWLLRRQLLIAKVHINRRESAAARRALAFVDQLSVSPGLKAQAEQLLARLEQPAEASTGQLPQLLLDLATQLANVTSTKRRAALQAEILSELGRFPLALLNRSAHETPEVLLPFFRLAAINRSNDNPGQTVAQINRWQQEFPFVQLDAALMTELAKPELSRSALPTQVALILPYTGDMAQAAAVLHQGVMTSYFTDPLAATRVTLRSYDSGNTADIAPLYRQAITDGAELVIGPLDKQHIRQLVEQQLITVPTLALNRVELPGQVTPQLVQFGLSPEDEIAQLSRLAWTLGHRRASIFFPDTPLGIRLKSSFEQNWRQLGGSLANQHAYPAAASDFSNQIMALLDLDESKKRHQRLAQRLAVPLQFTPRRRQDIDFIFLAAFAQQARAIRPQFRFHQADDLPIFATSHLYSGSPNPPLNQDLNQIRFCDTPTIFSGETPDQALPRINGLGQDAFGLLAYLPSLTSSRLRSYRGATGNLTIDEAGRVHGQLACGRFRRGTPVKHSSWH